MRLTPNYVFQHITNIPLHMTNQSPSKYNIRKTFKIGFHNYNINNNITFYVYYILIKMYVNLRQYLIGKTYIIYLNSTIQYKCKSLS